MEVMVSEITSNDLREVLGEKIMQVANLELNVKALQRDLSAAQASACDCDKDKGKGKGKNPMRQG